MVRLGRAVRRIADLRLVVMTYQSFNTDRLDEREKEIANVFAAMREAMKKFADGKKAVGKGAKR